jgi:hypothetical protein
VRKLNGVGQGEVAPHLGIGGFRRSEGLGYGAELEQRAVGDGLSSGGVGEAVIEYAGRAAGDQTDRHAGNAKLPQRRPYREVDCGGDAATGLLARACGRTRRAQQRERNSRQDGFSHRITCPAAWDLVPG